MLYNNNVPMLTIHENAKSEMGLIEGMTVEEYIGGVQRDVVA